MNTKQNDRVSFSFGMKLSLPTKYESADFHISLASDVSENETSTTAFNRVKAEVETYVELVYQQIRNSEEGLTHELQGNKDAGNKLRDTKDVGQLPKSISELPKDRTAQSADMGDRDNSKPKDIKILKTQIKHAFGVLEAQKKITKSDFVKNYLNNKKTDDLTEIEVTKALIQLREKFPELGL